MTRRIHIRPVLMGALVLLLGSGSGLAGQSLHLAELFAKQGREGDARAEVLAWFEIRENDATPDELQHGLWLRGLFATDAVAATDDFQRLLDQFPGGPYTDLAAEVMAEQAAERGDERAAAELYTRIVREHPESAAAPGAWAWLASRNVQVDVPTLPSPASDSNPPPLRRPARVDSVPTPPVVTRDSVVTPAVDTTAADPPAPPEPVVAAPPKDSVEVAPPTVDSAKTPVPPRPDSAPVVAPPVVRDSTPAPPRPAADTVSASPTPPTATAAAPPVESVPHGPPVPGAAEGGAFAVQIGAYRNLDGPRRLVSELVAAGLDARLVQVPMNDLYRVRIGRFPTLEAAGSALAELTAAGRSGAVVNDARRETVVR